MNKQVLLSEMALHGDTGTSLAEYLGIDKSSFSAKINEANGREFTKSEISAIKKKYKLTATKTMEIFFQ